jgi:hypothetical protein
VGGREAEQATNYILRRIVTSIVLMFIASMVTFVRLLAAVSMPGSSGFSVEPPLRVGSNPRREALKTLEALAET